MNTNLHSLLAEYPLETLLQTIPTGLFLVNTDLQIVYWNVEAERLTGYSAAEAVGQHCSFLEGVPCRKKCGLFATEINKPVTGISCSIRHKSGARVELSKNFDLLRDKQGEVIGGIEAFVDISRQKEQEYSLRHTVVERTHELELEKVALRSVLDGMTDPVYICDGDYKITFVNRAMRELFGDIDGQPCFRAIHQLEAICNNCPLVEVLAGQEVCGERTLTATGQSYEIAHSPYPTAEKPSHKLAVFRDITQRKAAEQRLQQVNRELDAFVSTVSHDLRSPLTPLIGFAELLEDRYADQLDDIGRQSIAEIRFTASKMMHLLEDLLTLARVGQLKNPPQKLNARQIADDVLVELSDQVVAVQGRVIISDLPDFRIPESLMADLFRNLLGNALKYAAVQNPCIEITGQQFADRIQYRVIDHGVGIPAAEQVEIFELFRRGSNSSGEPGTGVGLATVARIARVYNGAAWVEDTAGGGATFVVELTEA